MQKVLLVLIFVIVAGTAHSQKFRVVENSRIAKLVAKIKKEKRYAVTFGKTIFINCSKEQFFAEHWWVRHELVHVQQYQKKGTLHFLIMYLFYSMYKDYSEVPFEKEAISAEYPGE